MKTVYDLKPAFQNKLRPVSDSLVKAGVTANQITILSALMSMAYGIAIFLFAPYKFVFLFMPVVLFIRMALNAIDGMMAREHGQQSSLGGMLNEIGDVVSDIALYLPLAFVLTPPTWLLLLVLLTSITAEIAGLAALQIGADRRYDGPFGKSDRALAFGTVCFFLGIGLDEGSWLALVFAGMLALSIMTICNRVKSALTQASVSSKSSAFETKSAEEKKKPPHPKTSTLKTETTNKKTPHKD